MLEALDPWQGRHLQGVAPVGVSGRRGGWPLSHLLLALGALDAGPPLRLALQLLRLLARRWGWSSLRAGPRCIPEGRGSNQVHILTPAAAAKHPGHKSLPLRLEHPAHASHLPPVACQQILHALACSGCNTPRCARDTGRCPCRSAARRPQLHHLNCGRMDDERSAGSGQRMDEVTHCSAPHAHRISHAPRWPVGCAQCSASPASLAGPLCRYVKCLGR